MSIKLNGEDKEVNLPQFLIEKLWDENNTVESVQDTKDCVWYFQNIKILLKSAQVFSRGDYKLRDFETAGKDLNETKKIPLLKSTLNNYAPDSPSSLKNIQTLCKEIVALLKGKKLQEPNNS